MRLFAIFIAAAMLAGCQTSTDGTSVPNTVATACSLASVAHAGFVAVSLVRDVPAKTTAIVDGAWDELQPICANPGDVTRTDLMLAAGRASSKIMSGLAAAKRAKLKEA